MRSKKEICRTWFDRVWSQEDPQAIYEMFVPEGDAHGLRVQEPIIGPEAFAEFHRTLLHLIGDVKVRIVQFLEDGDWVSLRCEFRFRDRNKPHGDFHITPMACTVRIVDGKIREAHNYVDFMRVFEKLNLLPEDVFSKCLQGRRMMELSPVS